MKRTAFWHKAVRIDTRRNLVLVQIL